MKKRVLITGATGFIGRHTLKPLIERGFEVHAVFHGLPLQMDSVTWHQSDLLKDGSAEALCSAVRATHLLHFAWIATPGEFWTSPENERWKNATIDLMRTFKKSGGSRAIIAGTCAEYDWTVAKETLPERAPLKPATLYGKAKNDTRIALEGFAEESGLSLGWGRIFFLYGPHEPPSKFVAYIVNELLAGRKALLSPCEQIRDFLYAADVGEAFSAFLDSPVSGAVNIASGKLVALKEIALEIGQQLGKEKFLSFGAREASPSEPLNLVANVGRLNEELGWTPRTTISEGLEQTIAWWRENRA